VSLCTRKALYKSKLLLEFSDLINVLLFTLASSFCSTQKQYLSSEEAGKEEVTLQLLLHLSAQCGICFPCCPSSSSSPSALTASSIHLVHQVRDEASLEVIYCTLYSVIYYFIKELSFGFLLSVLKHSPHINTHLKRYWSFFIVSALQTGHREIPLYIPM